jgi:Thioredoxin domain-containing protein
MDDLKNIETLAEYENLILNEKVMVVFSTTWCPDCHFLKTFIHDLIKNNSDWNFYYVDRDKMIDLCIDLDIMGIPSFIAYHNGKEVARLVNKLRKTQDEIQSFIDGIEIE